MVETFIATCARDLEQLRLLLASLDRYLASDALESLRLAWIDGPDGFDDFQSLDTGRFRSRTRLHTPEDLGVETAGSADGWWLQQVAKLLLARRVRTEFYLVLDSKNIALRPIRPGDLVREGRAPWVLEPISPRKASWWRGSAWALRHPRFDRSTSRLAVSSATPFLFHTVSVNRMIDWLEWRHRMPLQRFLARRLPLVGRHLTPTEFTLYYVFMDRERIADRYHLPADDLHDVRSQMWTSTPRGEIAARLARILGDEPTGMFTAIQHTVWARLTAADRAALRERVAPAIPRARGGSLAELAENADVREPIEDDSGFP